MNTVEVLRAARALIDKPEKWTQHQYARDKAGKVVYHLDPSAVSFCATGAIARAGDFECPIYTDAYHTLSKVIGKNTLSGWNDESTHAEVLAAFDKAIAIAEASHE